MELAQIVAWAMFVVLIGWIGVVLWATLLQVGDESRAASEQDAEGRGDGRWRRSQ
jgi:hypothetical protein